MISWLKDDDEDAEYNQHFIVIDGKQFLIYSDRDGERWTIEYPDTTTEDLEAKNLSEAKQEALKLVSEHGHD